MEIPCNVDIERSVLGLLLLNPEIMDGLRSTIEHTDFMLERHRITWQTACKLYDSGKQPDTMLVAGDLIDSGKLESVGGLSYLCELRDGGPVASSIDNYIGVLKEKASLRKILEFANVLTKQCQLSTSESSAMRTQISEFALTMSDSAAEEHKPVSTRDLIDTVGVSGLLRDRRVEGLALPWHRLNGALCGLIPGSMTVLAAYTGRGKTSMALQIAAHAARSGKAALYWTMEMKPERLFRRLVSQIAGNDSRNPDPTPDDRRMESEAVARLYDEPIYFDSHSRTVAGFRSSVAQVQAKTPLGLVVVDYIGLIRSSGRAESRTREVGENSRSLKLSAMDFNIPFLVLSQFKRPADGKPATIHDLKESGDVENDADNVLLVHSTEAIGNQPQPCMIHIGKNREGPFGIDIPLMFRPATQSFHSVEDY